MRIAAFMQKWGWFLVLGGAVFVAAYLLFGRKNAQTAAASTANSTTDANGNQIPVEYVPTSGDTYTNVNYNTDNSGNVNSYDPNSGNSGSYNPTYPPPPPNPNPGPPIPPPKPPINPGPPIQPGPPIPPPILPPKPCNIACGVNTVLDPATCKCIPKTLPGPSPTPVPPVKPPAPTTKVVTVAKWPAPESTLSGIAGANKTTWQILYNLNKSEIDQQSAAHGNPIPGGPWNNLFPGEQIKVPL